MPAKKSKFFAIVWGGGEFLGAEVCTAGSAVIALLVLK